MIEKHTVWTDQRRNIVQVECAFLTDLWDPLASVHFVVGPFDDPAEVTTRARQVALDLAHRQQPQPNPPSDLEC